MKPIILALVILTLVFESSQEEDFYKLLGVSKDATVKEIRKGFKALAVKLHPDKNKDDPEAEAKFIKLTKAYEILKDPTQRNRYDIYGAAEFTEKPKRYHSYSYYSNQFGIYDDDPLIVTLSRSDYEVNVLDDTQAWFVNFYSPNCHHCHELAPAWRKLAAELEGVIRIAAVNCEDDWGFCQQLSIEAYPTLLYYEKEANLYEGQKYFGDRTFEALKNYVLSKISVDIKDITGSNWDYLGYKNQQWLLFLCSESNVNCPEKETQIKLGATLDGLMSVGIITEQELCDKISSDHNANPVVFWQVNPDGNTKAHSIESSDSKDILDKVLNLLPNPETINEERFREIRSKLRSGGEKPWLLCFYMGPATELNLQLKRLPTYVSNINIGLVHCGKDSALCSSLHVARYPMWGVLKVGGAFEIHHGRDIIHEVAAFARDSIKSTNLHALSPADFKRIKKEEGAWFIDWYAPWCPPCQKLLPEVRKASQHFEPEQIQFGTVDCTLHRELCQKEGIRSYPSIIVYNGTQSNNYMGIPNEAGIREFIEDLISPTVIPLDESSFAQVVRKTKKEIWVVDFFAPWCGPCQKLGPEWRKFAKQVKQFTEVKVGQVDCVANSDLCSAQNIQAYPTIRLYPLGSKGLNTMAIYNGNRDATSLKRWLLSFIPSSIEDFDSEEFQQHILSRKYVLPWLVDFYAPWCGHCTHFEPEFRVVAQKLEGTVRTAKIDCEKNRHFCAKQYVHGYPSVYLYFGPEEKVAIQAREASQLVKEVRLLLKNKQSTTEKVGHDEL